MRIISSLYQGLNTNSKHLTYYFKVKWEEELNIEISDEKWHKMQKIHHISTNSRIWREFALYCYTKKEKQAATQQSEMLRML